MKQDSGVYQVTNSIDGKLYVGSAAHLSQRKWEHFNVPERSNPRLQNAMNKYGKENFVFEVVEYVEDTDSLVSKEQFYIDKAKLEGKELYNILLVASSRFGLKNSLETNRKISEANTGRTISETAKELIRQRSIERNAAGALIDYWKLNKGRKFGPRIGYVRAHSANPSPLKGRPSPLKGRKLGPKPESVRKLLSESCRTAWAIKRSKIGTGVTL